MVKQLTIIVPVYNEEENLDRVKTELSEFLKISEMPAKVLLVNDGSSDNSLSKMQDIVNSDEDFHYISFEKNAGLSAAIAAGFEHADTEWVGYIDADLQTNPEDFNVLIAESADYDLITGVRSNRKDSLVKNLSSTIANGIRRSFTHDGMDDTGCPLKIIRTSYAKKIPMFKGLHRFLPAMILLLNGRIKQVTVRHYPRIAGEAKYGLWNRLLGPLMDCFAYLWMKKKYINYNIKEQA